LFTKVEPPPGGVERFAARLDAETAAAPAVRPRRAFVAAAACVALTLVAAIVWLREPDDADPSFVAVSPPTVDLYNAPELDRLLGRPLRATELTVMLDSEALPITRLETGNERIRIYLIDDPAPAAPR
jgi:hypothetical protein